MRSAVASRCVLGSPRPLTASIRSASSSRHCRARMPAPIGGIIVSGERTSLITSRRPMRSSPETASSRASASPAASLASRRLALPRNGTHVRCGWVAASWATRRTDEVPTRAPSGSSSSVSPPGWTRASRMSSRSRNAANTVPAGSGRSAGTSLTQCTARSASPDSSAASTSLVNAPLPSTCDRSPSHLSPVVFTGTTSVRTPGWRAANSARTRSTCARAMGESRETIRISSGTAMPTR